MALVVLRQVKHTIGPIVQGMSLTLRVQAQRYAMAWALATMYAAAASLQALGEVAASLHWVYVAAFAKVTQPAVVAIIAFVNKAPDEIATSPKATPTNPPFPASTP